MEFEGLKYCSKCIMPETQEGASFNEKGECIACQAQASKQQVDWDKKKKELEKILNKAKKEAGDNYDCIVPISGGKDSAWQLYTICKEYGMKPIAVTFSHNWFSKTGIYNLQNLLEQLNVDHIQFTPNRDLINRMARRSIETIGDFCYACHAGVSAFTLQVAVKWKIPLIIWGESVKEHGHQGHDYNSTIKFDRDYFQKASCKVKLEDFVCDYISMKDLEPFKLPSVEECKFLNGIHLGDFIPWDVENQVEFIKKELKWKNRVVGGAYKKYKSIECSFAPLHDLLCVLKRGFGRATLQASQDIRDGKINREQAFYLVDKYERIESEHLHYALKTIGMTPEYFRECIEKLKHEKMKGININLEKEWRKIPEDGEPFYQRLIKEIQNEE